MIRNTIFLSLLLIWLPPLSSAIERHPWIGNYLEFEARFSLHSDYSPALASSKRLIHLSLPALFPSISLSNTLFPQFSLQAEAVGAYTSKQKGTLDHLSLCGRYVWLDDIRGDFLSLTTGVILTHASSSALKDISSYHHARSEAELFVSIGKEFSKRNLEWQCRGWSTATIGIADRGKPWLRTDTAFQYRFYQLQEVGISIHSLWGFGNKNLSFHHFHSYAPIHHASIEAGISYVYPIEYVGSLSLSYSKRFYARNFPAHTHSIWLTFLYTFGL